MKLGGNNPRAIYCKKSILFSHMLDGVTFTRSARYSESILKYSQVQSNEPLHPEEELEYGEIPLRQMTPDERRFFFARSWKKGVCAICSEPVENWITHMNLSTHQARYMICRHLISPEKYADIVTNMWHFLHYDVALIKDFDTKKDSRRRQRLHDTIKFLHRHNVILYSVYRWSESKKYWTRPVDFAKCLLAGESIVRSSVIDRISRIFQKASASEINALTEVIMDTPALCALYDALQINVILPYPQRRNSKLTPLMKRSLLLAMCGEMNWFVGKSRATDRAFNNALFPPSDVLVVHVLCQHAIESILIEIVHHYVQKVVKEILPIWSDFRGRLPYIADKIAWHVRPQKIHPKVLPYSCSKVGEDINQRVVKVTPAILEDIHRLTPVPNILPKPLPSWKSFIRWLNVDRRNLPNQITKVSFKKTVRSPEVDKISWKVFLKLPSINAKPCE